EGVKIKLADGNEATLPGSVIAHDSQRGARVVQQVDGKTADLDSGTVVSLSAVATVALPEAIIITGEDGKLRRLTEPNIVDVPVGTNVQLLGASRAPPCSGRFSTTHTMLQPTWYSSPTRYVIS